ncbi:hypothetical protein Bbelb_424110 [Branchiostoma belcheri]|nr:hypothetical protein Bbelb_424110 [Branchiostoma belcheri]
MTDPTVDEDLRQPFPSLNFLVVNPTVIRRAFITGSLFAAVRELSNPAETKEGVVLRSSAVGPTLQGNRWLDQDSAPRVSSLEAANQAGEESSRAGEVLSRRKGDESARWSRQEWWSCPKEEVQRLENPHLTPGGLSV